MNWRSDIDRVNIYLRANSGDVKAQKVCRSLEIRYNREGDIIYKHIYVISEALYSQSEFWREFFFGSGMLSTDYYEFDITQFSLQDILNYFFFVHYDNLSTHEDVDYIVKTFTAYDMIAVFEIMDMTDMRKRAEQILGFIANYRNFTFDELLTSDKEMLDQIIFIYFPIGMWAHQFSVFPYREPDRFTLAQFNNDSDKHVNAYLPTMDRNISFIFFVILHPKFSTQDKINIISAPLYGYDDNYYAEYPYAQGGSLKDRLDEIYNGYDESRDRTTQEDRNTILAFREIYVPKRADALYILDRKQSTLNSYDKQYYLNIKKKLLGLE